MLDEESSRPWEELQARTERGDSDGVRDFLLSLPVTEGARAMARLSLEQQAAVLQILSPADAADLIEQLPDAQVADVVPELEDDEAAAIVRELSTEAGADLIADLDEDQANAVLDAMPHDEATDLRRLAAYDSDCAGGLMSTEYLGFDADQTVDAVVQDLRDHAAEYSDFDVQYTYVSSHGRLVGVLRMRDLLTSPNRTVLETIMLKEPLSVHSSATLDELEELFDRHSFLALPVVDEAGKLVGVVRRAAFEEAVGDRADVNHLKSHGIVGGEELRSMPMLVRSGRRLAWLSVNVVLNVLAASVIALHQETLESVIALAVFLPIISDMSGCSGNQAVAVSLRELTLGLIRPRELFYVWLKEASVGLINGIALGLLLAVFALLWKGNVWLALVVGTALAINTVIAVSVGGLVPLVLTRLGKDPALASGPVLTTITDMCGFLLVLKLAELVLPRLR